MNSRITFLKSKFFLFLTLAIFLKLSLFAYSSIYVPETKIQPDSPLYLESGSNIFKHGAFVTLSATGQFNYVHYRTPGYPFFLGFLTIVLNLSLTSVVFIQIILTLLAAYVTYCAAALINKQLAPLSCLIVLFDLPVTVNSMFLLTEPLFLLTISLFMYYFLLYMKNRGFGFLVLSAAALVMATYIRPVTFFLGAGMSGFILISYFKENPKRTIAHAITFSLIVFSLLGIWTLRNHQVTGVYEFSTISHATSNGNGLYKSYERKVDPLKNHIIPSVFYLKVTANSVLQLMTYPGTLKYFRCEPLKAFGKIFGYFWVVFWLTGFLTALIKGKKDLYFWFLFFVIAYFIAVTVWGTIDSASGRFRIPMVPFLSILSAYGWHCLILLKKAGVKGAKND